MFLTNKRIWFIITKHRIKKRKKGNKLRNEWKSNNKRRKNEKKRKKIINRIGKNIYKQ